VTGMPSREAGFRANTWLVAKREFGERVRGRLFFVSTALLAVLAVAVALTPILVKVMDRGTTTRIAVMADEPALTSSSIQIIGGILNGDAQEGQPPPYTFVAAPTDEVVADRVSEGVYDGALIASRSPSGQITFEFLAGERMAPWP
jgi:ABC-type Na+ efflux pump permease subunit